MSVVQLLHIRLQRTDQNVPWGFNVQGGKDFHCPLIVQKVIIFIPEYDLHNQNLSKHILAQVNLNSLADKSSLRTGDYVIRIGNISTENLMHNQARDTMIRQGNNLELTLLRYQNYQMMILS
jgi:hypothetical protein